MTARSVYGLREVTYYSEEFSLDYAKRKRPSQKNNPDITVSPEASPVRRRPVTVRAVWNEFWRSIPGKYRKYILRILLIFLAMLLLYFFIDYWIREMRWRYIVVHHTASDIGNMEYYRRIHMEERGWPDVAYHFVINNGSYNTSVGEVEESGLWKSRSINYSTKISYLNYFGIAVVMVGNFDEHEVPPLQKEALVNLLTRLSLKYDIPPERILGHREVWNTKCPGKYLNMIEIREKVRRAIQKQKGINTATPESPG